MKQKSKEQAQYLLAQYIEGKASEEERDLLFRLLEDEKENMEWEEMIEELMLSEPEEERYKNMDWQPEIDKILNRRSTEESEPIVHRIGHRKLFRRMAVAAAILIIASTAAVFLLRNDNRSGGNDVVQVPLNPSAGNDIAPGGDRAILTLADGNKIVLDTASNGALAQQGGIRVIKIGGQLNYSTAGNSSQVLYNTITTPKGGQYQLELADGSRVWLNAASALRFPVAFTGNERRVELTGEGYFEVAHDKAKPFYVTSNKMAVQVLGTQFNVNAYDDETRTTTTLLEGSVSVILPKSRQVIKPGQQALVNDDRLLAVRNVETESVVAWKNGLFHFEGADIKTVMRQLARWYDVEVTYKGTIEKRFGGKIPRNVSAQTAFRILEETGGVHFQITGKKVTVSP